MHYADKITFDTREKLTAREVQSERNSFCLIYIFHFERKTKKFWGKKCWMEKYRLLPCGTFLGTHTQNFFLYLHLQLNFLFYFFLLRNLICLQKNLLLRGDDCIEKKRMWERENDVCCLWKRDMPKWKCLILWHLMKMNWILWGGFLWKNSVEIYVDGNAKEI